MTKTNKQTVKRQKPKGLDDCSFMRTIEGVYLQDKIGRSACEDIATEEGNKGLRQRYRSYIAENGRPSYGELYWND